MISLQRRPFVTRRGHAVGGRLSDEIVGGKVGVEGIPTRLSRTNAMPVLRNREDRKGKPIFPFPLCVCVNKRTIRAFCTRIEYHSVRMVVRLDEPVCL